MKRSYLLIAAFAAVSAIVGFAGVNADAKSAPAASPSPSALPTATPEPPDKAIPRLLDKLKANPNDQDSLVQLAQQYLTVERPDLSLPLTQKALSIGAKTAQIYYLDGFANERLNRTAQAIADYEQAGNLDPTNVGVLGALTQVYLKTNRLSDAERVAKRAVTFNKTDPRATINYGLVLATEQKWDDARAQFEAAYKLDATDVTPILQISQTYVSQNQLPNALAAVNRAIAADPKNLQAFIAKGDVYAKQHDIVNAIAAYEQAANLAPDDDTRAGLIDRQASFLASEKKNSEAEAAYQRAISRFPTIANTHLAFGDYWNAQNQGAKAEAEWVAALGPNKDNTDALVRLGTTNLKAGRANQAITYLKRLAELNPDPRALQLLGQAYTYTKDYPRAGQACRAAYQLQPSPEALGCIAGSDFEQKNYREAAQIFDVLDRSVHQYLDQNPTLVFIAGKSYANTNQKTKAVSEYRRLLAMMKPGSPSYKQVQVEINNLSKSAPKTKHG